MSTFGHSPASENPNTRRIAELIVLPFARVAVPPSVLLSIARLTEIDAKGEHRCWNHRGDLVNLFNMAPDAIDSFLLPFGESSHVPSGVATFRPCRAAWGTDGAP